MTEEKKQKLLGLVCAFVGAAFVIAGIVIFIMSNYMNFQMKKADATVMAMYQIDTVDGARHTMVELSYRVGTELVMATYEYPGILDESTASLDVYYNVKEPTMVFDMGWYLQPLLVLALGIPILITGLYYMGMIDLNAFKLVPPDQKATNTQKELYNAKKDVVENALPMLAGILFITFGIVMLVTNRGWWAWMFIVIGAVELLYIGMVFVPGVITWINLGRISKLKTKAKVYDVEMTTDDEINADDTDTDAKEGGKQSEEKTSDDGDMVSVEEELEPFEIKDIKTKKVNSRKSNKTNKKTKK